MRSTLSHYALILFKNELERALVALALGMKNPREEDWVQWLNYPH
jgi:hypothetical protein